MADTKYITVRLKNTDVFYKFIRIILQCSDISFVNKFDLVMHL